MATIGSAGPYWSWPDENELKDGWPGLWPDPEISDDAIVAAVTRCKPGCHDNDLLRKRIREATGYTGTIQVSSREMAPGHGTSIKITQFMVTMFGPRQYIYT